ncbi:MAG: hypothetical protein M1826_006633 [Phylliscum demangeonii]|nr:MAG: hypothetical protein M1826_006633 [Phylliscum demangeonii]
MHALLPTPLLLGSWITLGTIILTTTAAAAPAPAPAVLHRRQEFYVPPPEGDGPSSLTTLGSGLVGSFVGSAAAQVAIHKAQQWRQAHPATRARTPTAPGSRAAQGAGSAGGASGGLTELHAAAGESLAGSRAAEAQSEQRRRIEIDRSSPPQVRQVEAGSTVIQGQRPGSRGRTEALEPANAASKRLGLTHDTWLEQSFGMKVRNDDEEGKAIERCIRIEHDLLEADMRARQGSDHTFVWHIDDIYNRCRGPRYANVAAASKWAPADVIHHWKTIGHQTNSAFALLDPVRREARQIAAQAEHATQRFGKWAAAQGAPAWARWETGAGRAAAAAAAHPVPGPVPAWEY